MNTYFYRSNLLKDISIIIPTRNRAYFLNYTLNSIKNTSWSELCEIIIIDNGSIDDTREIVATFQASSLIPCRYVYEPTPGLHVGRNLGAQLAQGDILAYLDDDVIVTEYWLKSIAEAFQLYPDLALLGGPCLPQWASPPPSWILQLQRPCDDSGWILSELSLIDLNKEKLSTCSPYHIFGCNFIVRKKIIFDAGGFHPDGMPNALIKYRGDGEIHISDHVKINNLNCMWHPLCSVQHCIPPIRLTKSYIESVTTRTIYSCCFSECRKSEFNLKKFIRILFPHLKIIFKLTLSIHKSQINKIKYEIFFVILTLRNFFSPKLRKWICQKSFYKEDPCPYK